MTECLSNATGSKQLAVAQLAKYNHIHNCATKDQSPRMDRVKKEYAAIKNYKVSVKPTNLALSPTFYVSDSDSDIFCLFLHILFIYQLITCLKPLFVVIC